QVAALDDHLTSLPTRRSSDLIRNAEELEDAVLRVGERGVPVRVRDVARVVVGAGMRRGLADLNGEQEVVGGIIVMRQGENALDVDRKSTRLNSSHQIISYAVF